MATPNSATRALICSAVRSRPRGSSVISSALPTEERSQTLLEVGLTQASRQTRQLCQCFRGLLSSFRSPVSEAGRDELAVHLRFLLGETTQDLQMAGFDSELEEIARYQPNREILCIEIQSSIRVVFADHAELPKRLDLGKFQSGCVGEIAFVQVDRRRALKEIIAGFHQ